MDNETNQQDRVYYGYTQQEREDKSNLPPPLEGVEFAANKSILMQAIKFNAKKKHRNTPPGRITFALRKVGNEIHYGVSICNQTKEWVLDERGNPAFDKKHRPIYRADLFVKEEGRKRALARLEQGFCGYHKGAFWEGKFTIPENALQKGILTIPRAIKQEDGSWMANWDFIEVMDNSDNTLCRHFLAILVASAQKNPLKWRQKVHEHIARQKILDEGGSEADVTKLRRQREQQPILTRSEYVPPEGEAEGGKQSVAEQVRT